MKFRGIFFTIACIGFIISTVNGQEKDRKSNKKDTISEVIVYEYDTVYVAPDTMKVTDTIIQYQVKEKSVESKKNSNSLTVSLDFFEKLNFLESFSDKWSIGFGTYTFVNRLFKNNNLVDSFAQRRTLNTGFEVHLTYKAHQFKYSLGFGYLKYREQLQSHVNRYFNSVITSTGSYDSLLIKSNVTVNNYYQYLRLFFNVGKKWGNRKTFFLLNGYVTGNLLLNTSAFLPTDPAVKISSSSFQKISYQVGVNPCIGFKILKQFEFSMGPFCSYTMFHKKDFGSLDQLFAGFFCRIQ